MKKMKCNKCNNPYQLPERDDGAPGFADLWDFYCEKCGEFLGTVRIDRGLPYGEGYGWILNPDDAKKLKRTNEGNKKCI